MPAIYAVLYCGEIVSREAERGTLETILSHPLPQDKVIVTKSASFTSLVFMLISMSCLSVVFGLVVLDTKIDLAQLALGHLISVLPVVAVSTYSILASCLSLDTRQSVVVAGITTAAMYLLNILAPILGKFIWLDNLSISHPVQILPVLMREHVNLIGVIVNISVSVSTFVAAVLIF